MVLIPPAISLLYKVLPKVYRRKFIYTSLSVFVMACVDLVSLGILLPVLLLVLSGDGVPENIYMSYLYEAGGFESRQSFTTAVCLTIFLISLGRTLFNTYIQYKQNKRLLEISSYLSLNLYQLYFSKGFLFIKQTNSFRIISYVNAVANNLIQGYFIPFTSLVCEVLVIVSILIGLILFDVSVSLLVFLTFVPMSFIYYRYSRSRIKKYGEFLFKVVPQKEKILQQTFVGYADMELNDSFSTSKKEYAKLLEKQNACSAKSSILNTSLQRVLELGVVCSVIVLILAAQLFTFPDLGVTVGIFVVAVYRILPGIVKSISYYFTMRGNLFSLDLLDELAQVEVQKEVIPQKEIRFEHTIRFESVSFSYDKVTPVIEDFSLEIHKGNFVSIKGESGSGKSTLFHLFLGFIRPDSGIIYVDGVPLGAEYMNSWRSKIGYVSQQLFMMEGSLLDNIVMGRKEVSPDQDRVYEVLKQASLDRFVNTLPDGLNTPVGEGGCLLSGGQKQRLGIARALYKQAEILLFDEATSSLDEDTEKAINLAILHLTEQRKDLTLLIISHRQELLSSCRKIVDLTQV